MPFTTPSVPTQTSEAPVTEAGTVLDGTRNDSKIFVGVTSVNPPTRYKSFILEGGSQVKFYCTRAAKSAFLANPKAVEKAADIHDEAHQQSYGFMSRFSQNSRDYSVDQLVEWKKRAKQLENATEREVSTFNNTAAGSNISMEVVRNPAKEWEASSGVTEVILPEIKHAAVLNQRRLISMKDLRKGDPSHPSSARPSVHSEWLPGDSVTYKQ